MTTQAGIIIKSTDSELSPIILDVGKKKKRQVKDLKRGRGRLMDEVEQTLEDVRAGLGPQAEAKEIVPVVLLIRQKPKRRRGGGFGRLW